MPGVKAKLLKSFPHEVSIADDALNSLGLFAHDLQGSQYCGCIRRRDAGTEDKTARGVLDVIHHGEAARNKAADGCHGFAEGRHD